MNRAWTAWMGLILILGLAACETQQEAEPQGKPKPRIALVMKSLANEFFKTMEDGAREHQQAHPQAYGLIANGIKDERDVGKQIGLVEEMIARRVDAIVIAPADSKAMVGVCKKAMDAGIVVVNIDNRFDAAALAEKGVTIPFVGPDNRKGARLAGEHLARLLTRGDKVAIVEGIPNAINGVLRKQGFEDAAKAAGLVVASSQTAYWETDKAEKVVAGMITQHPDLKAVLCANDSMALGAVAALKTAGRLADVRVVGFDNISAAQELMRQDKILCTVDQHADQIAVYGIQHALSLLAFQATTDKLTKDFTEEMKKAGVGVEAPGPSRAATSDDMETPVDLITLKELTAAGAK